MKPLGPSKARTELLESLMELTTGDCSMTQTAAILGGAIDEALYEVTGSRDKQQRAIFWKYLNHNLWDLIRTLKASNLLDKVR